MQTYANLSGQSNVAQYENNSDNIVVKFKTKNKDRCDTYKYTHRSAGTSHVEEMKGLATAGRGLNSYITKYVRKVYESKW